LKNILKKRPLVLKKKKEIVMLIEGFALVAVLKHACHVLSPLPLPSASLLFPFALTLIVVPIQTQQQR